MKNRFKFALVALLLAIAGEAGATPSRQIWIPSTDVQPSDKINLGIDNYSTMFRKTADNAQQRPTNYGLTAGLELMSVQILKMEVGIDLREPTDYPVLFNAKVGLPEDSAFPGMPALAIGGYDFGTKKNTSNYNLVYGMMAKTVPVLGRLSGGFYTGNGGLLKNHKGDEDSQGFMFSWDRPLLEISEKLWVAVDYQQGNNRYGALSFGASWNFTESTSVLVGYQIYNDSQVYTDSPVTGKYTNSQVTGKNNVTVQLDIDF